MPEERKLVTILFADIVGSTAITVSRDPEVVRATLRRTFDELRPILERHGGTVEKFIGDEVMAVFGAPRAHDDDADRAVRAAFAIRDRVKELSARPRAIPLELRIGINSGETVADANEGEGQFLVTGEPVNAAARIRGSAEPGEIVVGAATKRLTDRAVDYGSARSFDAKGIGRLESWPALALRSAVPTQHRGIEGLRAPMVGRDEELSLLMNAYDRTRAEGKPHLVTVFGAAGAGKSRLSDEFTARVSSRVRQGRCLPYGEGVALWPVQSILRADAGIAATDDLATARDRLADAVAAVFPTDADDIETVRRRLEVLAGLARADESLPEIAAADLADELAWGLRRYVERRAAGDPLVLVFEDVHWAAPAVLELIEHLAEWSKAALFLLCLARPEFLDTKPGWGGGKVNTTNIVLEPLTPDETRELVARLLDIDALNEAVRSTVVERAEGNPLYVEEFIRLLIESGQIAHRESRWIAVATGPVQVPPTLQGLIAARIDTASPEVKALLQRAAAIGRVFPTTGVAALSDGVAPASAHLRDAVRRDLLVDLDERGVGGGRLFRFKHVLIRDVAYASVPKAERSRLHDLYGRWYEETLGDRKEDFIDLLAYHAEQAYVLAAEMGSPEVGELARRAFDRLTAAATRARLREDASAAFALYGKAAAIADDAGATDTARLETEAFLAIARHQVEASPEAFGALGPLTKRARAQRATNLLIELLARTLSFLPTGERNAARAELRELALATGEPQGIVRAMVHRINDTSPFEEDIRYLGAALDVARQHGLRTWIHRCLIMLTFRERIVGRWSDAVRHLDEWAQTLGESAARGEHADLLTERARVAADLADVESTRSLTQLAITLREDIGDLRMTLATRIPLIAALTLSGRTEEALAEADAWIGVADTKTWANAHRNSRFFRAGLLAKLGRIAEAQRSVADARAIPAPLADVPNRENLANEALVADLSGDVATAARLYADARAEFDRLNVIAPWFRLEYAAFVARTSELDAGRRELERLAGSLSDPMAGVWRDKTDALLVQLNAARV